MKKILALVTFIIWANILFANSDSTQNFYGLRYRQMLIVPHTSDLSVFSGTMPSALQFEYGRITSRKSSWDQCNCFSLTGFTLGTTNFNNSTQLGRSFDFTLFTEAYLFQTSKLKQNIRAGAGISWLTRPFSEEGNSQNYFYSTNIGFNLQLGYVLSFKLNDYLNLNAALMMNHISNGGMKKPNRGMNFPGIDISVNYSTGNLFLPDFKRSPLHDNRLKYWIQPFIFMQTGSGDYGFDIEFKPGIGLNLAVLKPLSKISNLGVGTELVYDGLFKEYDRKIEFVRFDPFSFALHVQHNLVFKKAVFANQFGYYIYRLHPFQSHEFYQRYSLHFKASERIYPGITLKAHASAAEYLAVSVAMQMN